MKRASILSFDIVLFLSVTGLAAIGTLFIFSSGINAAGVIVSREFIKQLIFGLTGIALMITFSFISYNTLRVYALYIYAATCLLLLLTLFIGREVNGAHSWLGIGELGIQPSEFAKISTILFLALYFTGIGNGIRELPRFLLGLLIIFAPMALILLQPDMGTALVFIPIFIAMAYIAGAQVKHLLFIVLTGLLTIVFGAIPAMARRAGAESAPMLSLLADAELFLIFAAVSLVLAVLSFLGHRSLRQRYFHWIFYGNSILFISMILSIPLSRVLQDYQIMRMLIFLNPERESLGAGWNIIQSITAIGSGGFWGKGFLQGTQSHYRYLPQQSTDFIFSILAEEWGFLGGILILGIFIVILLRGLSIVWGSRDDYAMLIGTGILAMLFFHLVVNVGMAMGIMPVTGIPLMLLSYGGSSLWTAMGGIGILMNISRRRQYH
jgi:rod shape determining protein RodA